MESTVDWRLKEKVMLEMGHDIRKGKKKEESTPYILCGGILHKKPWSLIKSNMLVATLS